MLKNRPTVSSQAGQPKYEQFLISLGAPLSQPLTIASRLQCNRKRLKGGVHAFNTLDTTSMSYLTQFQGGVPSFYVTPTGDHVVKQVIVVAFSCSHILQSYCTHIA